MCFNVDHVLKEWFLKTLGLLSVLTLNWSLSLWRHLNMLQVSHWWPVSDRWLRRYMSLKGPAPDRLLSFVITLVRMCHRQCFCSGGVDLRMISHWVLRSDRGWRTEECHLGGSSGRRNRSHWSSPYSSSTTPAAEEKYWVSIKFKTTSKLIVIESEQRNTPTSPSLCNSV